ncbi:MAG TPA: Gfo/Idh/MocA family oxidoreductase [Acidobacteriota bacterium]|nr:Gfo/Idh/MocA family oxidoreductase [Acidobacteriota bacterium]
MDYTQQPLLFRIRKVLRYVLLYGIRRTWIKVRAQYHMKRSAPVAYRPPSDPAAGGHVGLIGCGNFAYSNIAYYLRQNFGSKILRGCMDINPARAASLCRSFALQYFTTDAEQILADPAIDIVYVASNHASHAEYAIRALRRGKAVHIEKPHCVNRDQLTRLCRALLETNGKATLGFNRPCSRIGTLIRKYLDAQSGPAIFNWFLAGHQIDPDHWYFQEQEGGRVLGNLCHWTDFVYHLVPAQKRFPIIITPTRSDRSDCDIAFTYLFGDGSIAAITFSAKGHTFEGVRERFAAHKGDVLVSMDDFKTLTIEIGERKLNRSGLFRDHGHESRILASYRMVRGDNEGEDVAYIWETGLLFLETREALETQQSRQIEEFSRSFPSD